MRQAALFSAGDAVNFCTLYVLVVIWIAIIYHRDPRRAWLRIAAVSMVFLAVVLALTGTADNVGTWIIGRGQ